MFTSDLSLKGQLHHRSDDSENTDDLRYHLEGSFAKESSPHNTVESLQSRLQSARHNVENSGQRSSNFTKHFIAGVTDGFSGYLYDFLKEAQRFR